MTSRTYSIPGNRRTPALWLRLAASFSRYLATLKHKEKQYQDMRRLNEMTDDQLRDIGLHRADIRDAVLGKRLDEIRNEFMVKR